MRCFESLVTVMIGPHKPGTYIFPSPTTHWELNKLREGQRYRGVKEFTDVNGDKHVAGEEWEFIGAMFDRQSDRLTLCVRRDGNTEWEIPLIWTPEAQASVIESFKSFVMPVETP